MVSMGARVVQLHKVFILEGVGGIVKFFGVLLLKLEVSNKNSNVGQN